MEQHRRKAQRAVQILALSLALVIKGDETYQITALKPVPALGILVLQEKDESQLMRQDGDREVLT